MSALLNFVVDIVVDGHTKGRMAVMAASSKEARRGVEMHIKRDPVWKKSKVEIKGIRTVLYDVRDNEVSKPENSKKDGKKIEKKVS